MGDHETRFESSLAHQKSRKTAQLRIHQPFDAPFRNAGQFGNSDTKEVQNQSHRLAVEVTTQQEFFASEKMRGLLVEELVSVSITLLA